MRVCAVYGRENMFITLETDYAVRIVHFLCEAGTMVSAAEISEKTGVTLRFALKILRKLVAAGIISSAKGVYGGYILSRRPEEITLKQVVETVEGPIVLSRCLQDEFVCSNNADNSCYFIHVFNEISEGLSKKLDSVKFSDALSHGPDGK